jgi:hypothetical protein
MLSLSIKLISIQVQLKRVSIIILRDNSIELCFDYMSIETRPSDDPRSGGEILTSWLLYSPSPSHPQDSNKYCVQAI